MSAREDLFWMLWDNYTPDTKNEVIDAFAHELAEQIRAADRRWPTPAHDGALGAADLIDPETSRS